MFSINGARKQKIRQKISKKQFRTPCSYSAVQFRLEDLNNKTACIFKFIIQLIMTEKYNNQEDIKHNTHPTVEYKNT